MTSVLLDNLNIRTTARSRERGIFRGTRSVFQSERLGVLLTGLQTCGNLYQSSFRTNPLTAFPAPNTSQYYCDKTRRAFQNASEVTNVEKWCRVNFPILADGGGG